MRATSYALQCSNMATASSVMTVNTHIKYQAAMEVVELLVQLDQLDSIQDQDRSQLE